MLGLFVTDLWAKFYKKGMKTWDIRSYPINYRGPIAIINNKNNKVVCKMDLIDCIPLTKELWEMNFEKHRVSSSFEMLSYRQNNKIAYAWILKNPSIYEKDIFINRQNKKPYLYLEDDLFMNNKSLSINKKNERIACKFIDTTMLLYWLKNNYFALIGVVNLLTGETNLILDEINENEIDYIIDQINAK